MQSSMRSHFHFSLYDTIQYFFPMLLVLIAILYIDLVIVIFLFLFHFCYVFILFLLYCQCFENKNIFGYIAVVRFEKTKITKHNLVGTKLL